MSPSEFKRLDAKIDSLRTIIEAYHADTVKAVTAQNTICEERHGKVPARRALTWQTVTAIVTGILAVGGFLLHFVGKRNG